MCNSCECSESLSEFSVNCNDLNIDRVPDMEEGNMVNNLFVRGNSLSVTELKSVLERFPSKHLY